jgi:membrane protein DedA with SNARE-associated domain
MFDWVTGLVEQTGYLGIAFLMLAENVFPPIPSELIMPLAGFTAARGELNVVGVLLAGAVGSLAGALVWYYVGLWLGEERLKRWAARHGRWLTVTPGEVDQATAWFRRHGYLAVLFGRLVPAVRTLISVPAGIARMGLPIFLLYSGIGTVVWTTFLLAGGYLLEGRYHQVQEWLNPVSNAVIIVLVAWYLYRVVTFRPQTAG